MWLATKTENLRLKQSMPLEMKNQEGATSHIVNYELIAEILTTRISPQNSTTDL